jgi:predicted RNA-binding protein with TRAM domain
MAIDALGDQGDGTARVERGYVLTVVDTRLNKAVVIEVESVQSNGAFATITERLE